MRIDVLCEHPRILVEGVVERIFHFFPRRDGRVVYRRKWLLCLDRLFEEGHDLFELVFCALCRGILVHRLEEHIVLVCQVVRTATTVLYGRGEADIRRRLREGERVEPIIFDGALDGIGRRDVYLRDLASDGCCLRG